MNAQPQQFRQSLLRALLARGASQRVATPVEPAGHAANDTLPVPVLEFVRSPGYHPLQPLLARIETELERGIVLLPAWSNQTERARRALLAHADDDALAALMARDAGLAVRTLALANAAPYARGARELADLRPAIRRLGHVQMLALVHAHILTQLRHSPRLLELQPQLAEQWHVATAAAVFARRVAWRCGSDADLAFLCGLLHNCGRLYLLVRCAQLSQLGLCEQAAAGLVWRWQAKLGAALARAWELPPEVVRVIGRQGGLGGFAADETGAIVAAAARAVAAGSQDAATATLLAEESGIPLDAGQWRHLMTVSAREAVSLRVLLGD